MKKISDISRNSVRQLMAEAMRKHTARGKDIARKTLSHDTKIPSTTLDGYFNAYNCPSLENWMKIALVLGPAFVNRTLEQIGMAGAHWLDPAAASHRQLHTEISRLDADFAEALQDGILSPSEKERLRDKARPLASELERFINH